MWCIVEFAENLLFIPSHNRFELKHIAYKQKLFASKRQSEIARIDAEDSVDEIDDICPYHTYLVDDDEFEVADEFHVFLIIFKEFLHTSRSGKPVVVGHKWMERQMEETMHSVASGIDRSNTGRCKHYIFLLCGLTDIFHKGRFTRTSLTCQENRLVGELHQIECILELRVFGIYLCFIHSGKMSSRTCVCT